MNTEDWWTEENEQQFRASVPAPVAEKTKEIRELYEAREFEVMSGLDRTNSRSKWSIPGPIVPAC